MVIGSQFRKPLRIVVSRWSRTLTPHVVLGPLEELPILRVLLQQPIDVGIAVLRRAKPRLVKEFGARRDVMGLADALNLERSYHLPTDAFIETLDRVRLTVGMCDV